MQASEGYWATVAWCLCFVCCAGAITGSLVAWVYHLPERGLRLPSDPVHAHGLVHVASVILDRCAAQLAPPPRGTPHAAPGAHAVLRGAAFALALPPLVVCPRAMTFHYPLWAATMLCATNVALHVSGATGLWARARVPAQKEHPS